MSILPLNPPLNIFSASTLFDIYLSFQYVHAFANVVAHVFNAERLAMLFYRQLKLASNLDNKIDVDTAGYSSAMLTSDRFSFDSFSFDGYLFR